jgi:uncharacterized protein YegL
MPSFIADQITRTPTTLVTFLLDRSGSMLKGRAMTIAAFNAYITELKQDGGSGIRFNLFQFDDQGFDHVWVDQPITEVSVLTEELFEPRGRTPLYDSIIKTIMFVEKQAKDYPGAKIVVCIQTDGQENASREFTIEMLRDLIKQKQEADWQFNFMGANINAYASGQIIGFRASNTMSYLGNNPETAQQAFMAAGSTTRLYASGVLRSTNFSVSQRTAAGDKFFDKTDHLDKNKK